MNTISLNEKEMLFCRYYANCLDAKEAALRAGYPPKTAVKTGTKLLMRGEVATQVETLLQQERQSKLLEKAITGLQRLAFDRSNDAVLLALTHSELDEKAVEELNLYSISELKRLKDGGFEIKFTDRLKVLEALIGLAQQLQEEGDPTGFLQALMDRAEEEKDGTV